MKVYQSILKLRFRQGLQYRTAALAGVATQFFWGAIMIMLFTTFYGNHTTINGFSRSQLVDYIWLQQAFLAFVALWFRNNELFDLITTGNIAYEMCRPINTYTMWYMKLLASRLANAALRCLPILSIALLLPEPYRLHLPKQFILFTVTLLLGVCINVAISMYIYISVFITLSPRGSLLLFGVIGEFLSGMILPIPLMPEPLRNIVMVLPFRYTGDLPFRVYSGSIAPTEALVGIAIQLIWLMVLSIFGKKLMHLAMRHLVVQGG